MIIGIYLVVSFFSSSAVFESLQSFLSIIVKILPVLIMVFVIMAATNYAFRPESLVRWVGSGSGLKGWFIAVIVGIISVGPIYLWYPLLNDLQKKGMRAGLIAAFLYNRAVKIPLLPILILYFGLGYTLTLTVVMIVISILQGLITEKILGVRS